MAKINAQEVHGASARASALIVVNCAAGATRKVSSGDVFSTRSLLREATFPVSSKKSRPHDLARAYRGAHVHARACISAPHTCEVATSFNWRDRRLPFWISAPASISLDRNRCKQEEQRLFRISFFFFFSVLCCSMLYRRNLFSYTNDITYQAQRGVAFESFLRIYRWRNVAICNRVGNKVSRALRQTIIGGECTGEWRVRFVFVNFSLQCLDHILWLKILQLVPHYVTRVSKN